MFAFIIRISFTLILLSVTIFENVQGRYVEPVTYYTVRLPQDGLAISASESRPVFVDLVNQFAQHVGVAPISAKSDILNSDASVKVEKILSKPMSFSYNSDQDHQASSQNSAQHAANLDSQPKDDQQTDAIDYYKYLARIENEEKGGAAHQKKHDGSTTPTGFHKSDEKHASKAAHDHHDSTSIILESQPSEETEVKEDSDHEKVEDGETSASEHKGGGNKSFEKGGGKDHHKEHHDIHDQKGEKVYDGRHHLEKGDIGKHEKKDHDDHYTEDGGHKEAKHDEDEYHSEHEHGEDGKQGAQFDEDGEHSKGHSTSGEHNVHKKDEYEKKQEFYDESHEGGDQDKHGEYFHEDGFEKGAHHKSDHKDGGDHKDHYGKDKHYEHGGHKHVDVGHDKSAGQDKHHDDFEKGGKEVGHKEEKGWHYKHSHDDGGGHKKGDSEGHGSKIEEVASSGKKADDAEAHGSSHTGQVANENKQYNYGTGEGANRYMLVIVDDNIANGQSS